MSFTFKYGDDKNPPYHQRYGGFFVIQLLLLLNLFVCRCCHRGNDTILLKNTLYNKRSLPNVSTGCLVEVVVG